MGKAALGEARASYLAFWKRQLPQPVRWKLFKREAMALLLVTLALEVTVAVAIFWAWELEVPSFLNPMAKK